MQSFINFVSESFKSLTSSKVVSPRDLVVNEKVSCTFGKGYITEIRSDGIHVVKLDNWKLANGKSPTCYLNKASLKSIDLDIHKSNISKAFQTFKAGDNVKVNLSTNSHVI